MESDDVVSQLPSAYPVGWEGAVTLKDGLVVWIRPIRPDDASRLQEGFMHLSAESRYYRFLDTARQLSDEQAHRLANLDYQNQMAFVATMIENGEEYVIGVARYARVEGETPGATETAVVVGDDYQGRGLGTLLYIRLIDYARQHGIQAFTATIHQSNTGIMKFIRKGGLPFERKMLEPGVFLVTIYLNK